MLYLGNHLSRNEEHYLEVYDTCSIIISKLHILFNEIKVKDQLLSGHNLCQVFLGPLLFSLFLIFMKIYYWIFSEWVT